MTVYDRWTAIGTYSTMVARGAFVVFRSGIALRPKNFTVPHV
jgi:hypothetical protein